MTPEAFAAWLAAMKAAGLARTDIAAGRIIGKSPDTVVRLKQKGADRTIAMACAAALKNLQPYGEIA